MSVQQKSSELVRTYKGERKHFSSNISSFVRVWYHEAVIMARDDR